MGQQSSNCLPKSPDHDPSATPIPAKMCLLWHNLILQDLDSTFSSLTCSAVKYFLLPSAWMKFPAQATPHSHISEMLVLKSLWTMSYGMGQMVSNFWRRVWSRNQHNTCSHSLLAASTLTRVPVSTFVVLLDFCIQGQSNQKTITSSIILQPSIDCVEWEAIPQLHDQSKQHMPSAFVYFWGKSLVSFCRCAKTIVPQNRKYKQM